MNESFQTIGFTESELDQLQQLRVSVLAFQNMIAALPADEQNNARNEQFNQLRAEAKALLKDHNFDKKVVKAITQDVLTERQQRVLLPQLSGIVMFGVILALLGLGINSVILDDFVINSLACLVSSGGMALVIGAFGVWLWTNSRRRLSNLGELYLNCNALLHEINHALNQAIPSLADYSVTAMPETPSVLSLWLDSLHKQASDWQQKSSDLEQQSLTLGVNTPAELKLNLDFVQRQLSSVRQEIARLEGHPGQAAAEAPVRKIISSRGAPMEDEPLDPTAVKRARSVTLDMPAHPAGEANGDE